MVGDGIAQAPGRYPVGPKLDGLLSQAGVVPAAAIDADKNHYVSDTGEIELAAKPGTVKVVTDRCEMFSLPPNEHSNGRVVSVENGQTFGSAYVVSADGKSLAQSDRLLVLFLTDSLNQDMVFRNSQATVLENYGAMKTLVKRGTAKIKLRLPGTGDRPWKGWIVDVNGTRGKPVTLASENDAHVLSVDTVADGVGCLAWELTRSR